MFRENPFKIEGTVVYWGRQVIGGADAATFEALNSVWAVDAATVYVQNKRRANIDRTSFRLLNPVYAVDKRSAYDWIGPILGTNPKTFEVLDSGLVASESNGIARYVEHVGYARDEKKVYFHDQMWHRATPVPGAEPKSFQSLRNGFGVDCASVFFNRARLPKAEPSSWVYLGRGYSTDGGQAYYLNRPLSGVDCASFAAINLPTIGNFATDGTRWFNNHNAVAKTTFWKEIQKEAKEIQSWAVAAAKAEWGTR